MDSRIPLPFDPEEFRKNGHQLVDTLADYLSEAFSRDQMAVLPHSSPEDLVRLFSLKAGDSGNEEFGEFLKRILKYSHHLHHPRYIGHQVSSPLPMTALMHACTALLNNGAAIYEMGPVVMAMERNVIRYFGSLMGYSGNYDGVFTHGGSAGNLTALLAARQAMSLHNIWQDGVRDQEKLGIMVSDQSHYSIARTVKVMGLGDASVIRIPYAADYKMRVDQLESCRQAAESRGIRMAVVVANACSTATGAYDDLEAIGHFCEKHGLWMHVDGAHGMGVLFSEKYRHLVRGIEKADSVVIDFHKMFLVPALNTMVLFKKAEKSFETFAQKASYLFDKAQQNLWQNGATRTLECTKSGMGIIAYTALKYYGGCYFKDYIESRYELARQFADLVTATEGLELAVKPEANIVCFRYAPEGREDATLNALNAAIRSKIVQEGSFYIVQTELDGRLWLRVTIINPLTTEADLNALIGTVIEVGSAIGIQR